MKIHDIHKDETGRTIYWAIEAELENDNGDIEVVEATLVEMWDDNSSSADYELNLINDEDKELDEKLLEEIKNQAINK